jgi:hypothetical protein
MDAQDRSAHDRVAALSSSSSFGQTHFGGCVLGDRRLVKRAVSTADAMLSRPGGTLPAKLHGAALTGFYDLANNVKLTHAKLIAAHTRRTLGLMGQCTGGVVLVIHDTTDADFSGLSAAEGLGQIGNGQGRGFLLHNALAVDFDRLEVLGLVGQFPHVRRTVNRKEGLAASRAHPQRESRLWVKGVEAVGTPPPGATWVNLMDRGGDTFESLDRQQRLGQWYVVRSRSNRNVRVADQAGRMIRRKLHHWARRLPPLGNRSVEVAGNHKQQARTAQVQVSAGPVELQVPNLKWGEHGRDPLAVWVVRVWEPAPPAGQDALEWILLTNVPVVRGLVVVVEQAWERVDWYLCRPIVEELHKALKTGCGMELMQFTTRKALEVSIAMLSVVAVQLLRLRDLARHDDTLQATRVVAREYVDALSLWRWKEVRGELSARQFLAELGRMGGHRCRRGDGPPGWLVLWRGWTELQRLVDGMRLGRLQRSG